MYRPSPASRTGPLFTYERGLRAVSTIVSMLLCGYDHNGHICAVTLSLFGD